MLLFYSDTNSPRLQYIVDFFSDELFDDPIVISSDQDQFRKHEGPKINYSQKDFSETEFFLRNTPLLFEKGIKPQSIECFELNFQKAFFATKGDLPFDIFAASFYLLSRYEEYLPHEKDEFGRYDYKNSLAFREGFLRVPLLNLWIEDFKKALIKKYPSVIFKRNQFKCLLTYDIDIAYCYKNKGALLNTGGFIRSLLKGDLKSFKERWAVLNGKKRDPYDCFEWLDALHLYCRIKPYYFFLVAKKQQGYDKNINTSVKKFRELIEYYSKTYKVGIHPSWQSGDDSKLLKEEKEWLEVVADKPIHKSRQHYIRLQLPETFRRLIDNGITKDFSMGYGSINGFRASVCSSYNWYDLEQEKSTDLLLYPFCYMDANSFFEMKHSPREAYDDLIHYYTIVKKHMGVFIPIWHNNILGTQEMYKGWREMFEIFMKETVYWDAYYDAD